MIVQNASDFNEGRNNVNDEQRSGRPSIITDDLVAHEKKGNYIGNVYLIHLTAQMLPSVTIIFFRT